jgi:uncharacterized protein (DUF58 family)
MRTRANTLLVAAAVTFLSAGFFLRSWTSVALVVPIVVWLVVARFTAPPGLEVEVSREVSHDRLVEGRRIRVVLRITNRGRSHRHLEVYDGLPQDMVVVEGTNHVITRLGEGEEAVIEYAARCALKGHYLLGPVLLRSHDLLGHSYREVLVAEEARVAVIPLMQDIRKAKISPLKTRLWLGQIRSRQRGLGTEFWSLREYNPGDEIRMVNWKASARTGRLHTNEYEGERSGDAIIILDAREEFSVGPVSGSTTEWGVRAAASVASRILQDRNRVGLIIQRDVLDWVYPGYGKGQFFRIMDALTTVRPGGKWPFEHVTWVVSRFFPKHSQIIIISPLTDRRAVKTVTDLCAHGFDVLIVSPSPLEIERAFGKGGPLEDTAYAALRMEREAMVSRLRRYAEVVDWNPRQPLAAALKGVRPFPRRH